MTAEPAYQSIQQMEATFNRRGGVWKVGGQQLALFKPRDLALYGFYAVGPSRVKCNDCGLEFNVDVTKYMAQHPVKQHLATNPCAHVKLIASVDAKGVLGMRGGLTKDDKEMRGMWRLIVGDYSDTVLTTKAIDKLFAAVYARQVARGFEYECAIDGKVVRSTTNQR